jgi:hypothetical protein
MADYSDLNTTIAYLGGTTTLSGTDQALVGTIITACSRAFDRETNRPINWWAPQTGVTRRYSGTGTQWLDIDEFGLITGVTMSTNQSRSDAVTLTVTPPSSDNDPTWPNFVEVYPLNGPPYTQLFLLRSWLPDAWKVGNIAVMGNIVTPPEITDAVSLWVAYRWKRMRANWAERVSIAGGPSLQWGSGTSTSKSPNDREEIPAEVRRAIDYFTGEVASGPKVGLVAGNEDTLGERVSPWLSWRTHP